MFLADVSYSPSTNPPSLTPPSTNPPSLTSPSTNPPSLTPPSTNPPSLTSPSTNPSSLHVPPLFFQPMASPKKFQRLRMFPGSFSDMLRHTPVSRFRVSGDPWYQEIVVRYRARRTEEEREGVRERNERGRGGEEEAGGVAAVGVGREESRREQGQQREHGRPQQGRQQHMLGLWWSGWGGGGEGGRGREEGRGLERGRRRHGHRRQRRRDGPNMEMSVLEVSLHPQSEEVQPVSYPSPAGATHSLPELHPSPAPFTPVAADPVPVYSNLSLSLASSPPALQNSLSTPDSAHSPDPLLAFSQSVAGVFRRLQSACLRRSRLRCHSFGAKVGRGCWLATSGSMAACSVNLKRVVLLWIIATGCLSACVAGDVPSWPGRKDARRTSRELSDGGGAGGPFNVFPAQSYLNVLNFNIPLPRLPQLPFPLKDKLKDKFNKFHKSPPPSPPPPSPSPPPPSPPPPKKSPPPPKKSPPPPEKKSPPPPEHKSPPPPEHKSPPPPKHKSPPPPKHKSPPPPKHKSPPPPKHKSPPPPEKKSPPPPEHKSPPPPEKKSPPPPKHKSPPPPEKKSPPPPEHKSPPPPKHNSPPPPEKKSPPPPEHKSPPPPKHKSLPPPEKKSPPPPEHKSPPPPKHKSPPPPEKKLPPPPEKKSPPPPSPSPPPPPPPRKPSKKDHLIIILLKGAAVLVRKAHGILPPGNDSQKEDLRDVVKALGDAEVLINEGRRELVREQLDNSVATLEEVGRELQGGWVQEQAAGGMIGLARVEIMKAQALFQE
ncbi:unnamed protein product [Closterium sp. Naga37s-1]|nr:unnamed protein product [Closterium sp. Naga37s-1]